MIKFIDNTGDFFSSNYFNEDFVASVHKKSGYGFDDQKELQKRITPVKDRYYKYKQTIIEGRLRIKDKIYETHLFHTVLLNALGYDGDRHQYDDMFHFSEEEVLPVRHRFYRGDKLHLMIMEMQPLIKEGDDEPDGLFEQRYNIENELEVHGKEQRFHRSQWERVFKVPPGLKISPVIINKAISQLCLLDPAERPQYIMLLAGNTVFLVEAEKWFRGSFLVFNLEELFTEGTIERKYYSLFYLLLSKEMLAPDSEMVLLDQLDEDSHKSAYEVTQDLKEGVIHAVEALANEALYYKKEILQNVFDETDDRFEQEIKDDCLSIVYRLLFIFYAESRGDLEILPINDNVYQKGYSLEMLRDLEQTKLITANSLNGYFFHESLSQLFTLMTSGYRENQPENSKNFRIRKIDSPLFDDKKLHHLKNVKFRNFVWQEIIQQLSLSRKQKGRARGRISYANLGVNQLGSVYESLLAYRGFYAEQDYIEVHKKDNPKEGTFLVPRVRRDVFEPGEVLVDDDNKEVLIKKGTFVYRLSGRDRQKSASYYTPEVLTRTTVKYTLKSFVDKLDKGEMKALDLLDMKLLEPAMGAAAFQNEMINQLAELYLNYRQKELKDKISPDKFREELQKVKAYIATHNTYGVDLNPTAIELGKLALWLNVIHKDMETPFFANRLAVGNAVVGAWLKVYPAKELLVETDKSGIPLKRQPKKEWWETAPVHLKIGSKGVLRKENEIYHFLLPDKNMVSSAGIPLLKEEYPIESNRVRDWKAEWIKPLLASEVETLKRICTSIDGLLKEYYQFQRLINQQTQTRFQVWGAGIEEVQTTIRSYHEKEELDDYRNRHNAPYYKLKLVFDYWCALWFWDMRQASELPDRKQYWYDIAAILDLDLNKAAEQTRRTSRNEFATTQGVQLDIFRPTAVQLKVEPVEAAEKKADEEVPELPNPWEGNPENMIKEIFSRYSAHRDLFDANRRIRLVQELAAQHHFFHPQLEFIEVFWERGGFDLIGGNPPWVKITFEEKDIISEKYPEILLRKTTAPQVKLLGEKFLDNSFLKSLYEIDVIETEATSIFMNSVQNYPLLIGQQTNLYKCVLENGFSLLNKSGYLGLLHPEGIFEDPKGQVLRAELYRRIKYHFQFLNELFLFQDVGDRMLFSINIYAGIQPTIDFILINNLFHPKTIDGCFIHDGSGICGGFKVKDEAEGKFVWNTKPHKDRIINCTEKELRLFATLFESTNDYKSVKMVNIQSEKIVEVLERISSFKGKVSNSIKIITVGWDETNAVNNEIVRNTRYVDIDSYEFVFSGPHFHVANPLNKTPRSVCTEKAHYDVIDLTTIESDYFTRTNYVPNIPIDDYIASFKGFKIGKNEKGDLIYDNWIDYYKVGFSKMLNTSSERTLQPAILPKRTSHINGVISVTFKNESNLIEFTALSSSIVFDFLIKTIGTANLTNSRIISLPLGVNKEYHNSLFLRTLLLNCVNINYSKLWQEHFKDIYREDSWSKKDERLLVFSNLANQWKWDVPVRNAFARRWALVEIDVISAIALGLTLEELLSIFNITFPLMQQYEDETYYDQKGNIVFTVNRGLTGVGVDRPVWETIKHLKAGQTYEHTITKSELYHGKKVTYHAPFDKCDRVEDYKVAWVHFEGVFNNEKTTQ